MKLWIFFLKIPKNSEWKFWNDLLTENYFSLTKMGGQPLSAKLWSLRVLWTVHEHAGPCFVRIRVHATVRARRTMAPTQFSFQFLKYNFRQRFYNRLQNISKNWSAKRSKCVNYFKRKIQVSKILKSWYYRILILKKKWRMKHQTFPR